MVLQINEEKCTICFSLLSAQAINSLPWLTEGQGAALAEPLGLRLPKKTDQG